MIKTKSINRIIEKNKTFLVSTHENPDPDALCSEVVFAAYLRSLGKKVKIVNPGIVPERYKFLPGVGSVKPYRDGMRFDYDAAVVMDAGDIRRIGAVKKLLVSGKDLINIDHHVTNTGFGSVNLVFPKASSTTEVIYELLNKVDFQLTKSTAICLYVGIMTDTGSFRYDNTTGRTHEITAALMKFNFSADDLYRNLYECILVRDMKNFARAMKRFEVTLNNRVVCLELTKRIISAFSKNFDLRDIFFKFMRSIKGIRVFVIFTESKPDETRVNFRSTGSVDVAKLAHSYGGGGHSRASGCTVNKSMKDTRRDVLRKLRKML